MSAGMRDRVEGGRGERVGDWSWAGLVMHSAGSLGASDWGTLKALRDLGGTVLCLCSLCISEG